MKKRKKIIVVLGIVVILLVGIVVCMGVITGWKSMHLVYGEVSLVKEADGL